MVSGTTIGILSLIVFLVLIFLGIPVAICMMAAGLLGCLFLLPDPSSSLSFLSSSIVGVFTSYTVSVAPMFMLMGEIASESGIGANLFQAFRIIFGRLRGSLASSVQVACAIFGAICGSSPATCALMSRVAYPEMKKHGYSDELAAGCISAGAGLATLIPPSLILITYGAAVQESIGQLFFGGIFVGIILMLLFIVTIVIWCAIKPEAGPGGKKTSLKEKLIALKKGSIIEVIVVFGFSMAGMFFGWFTPTEAGAVGVCLMLLVTIFTKRFSFKMLFKAIENSLVMSGMIYCLLVGAGVFGKLFTLTRLSYTLGSFVNTLNVSGIVIIAAITLIYLIAGCVMDAMSVVLITAPIFLPILKSFGYNGIWFGVYTVVIAGLGAITPPVGMAAYIVSGVTGAPLQKVFKGCIFFIVPFVIMAFIMAFFPETAMWLPSLVF